MNGLRLKQRLSQPHICCLPGIFDFISLKVADALGFDALYMTGYGTVASHLGLPDAGLATYSDMVGRVQGFCASTSTPIVCDGDTGYGGFLNVDHTVRGYEKAGAAARVASTAPSTAVWTDSNFGAPGIGDRTRRIRDSGRTLESGSSITTPTAIFLPKGTSTMLPMPISFVESTR